MNRFITHLKQTTQTSLLLVTCLLGIGKLQAAPLTLSDVPMDVQSGVAPNVLLTFDNSGSMAWSYLPDSLFSDGSRGMKRGASSAYNDIYYNPDILYTPGVDANGKSLGDSTFTGAWIDGYDQSTTTSCKVDLETGYRATWYYTITSSNPTDNCDSTDQSNEYKTMSPYNSTGAAGAAYYYVYDTSQPSCTSKTSDDNCYRAVVLDSTFTNFTAPAARTDCNTTKDASGNYVCTLAEEQQNFANWYTYYRTRILMAKSAISRSFAKITGNVRISHLAINKANSAKYPVPTYPAYYQYLFALANTTIPDFQDFSGTNRTNFFNWLQTQIAFGGTPMREAFVTAGKDFTTSGIDSPYAEQPGVNDGTEYSCRQNFNIAITDGYWNDPSDNTGAPTIPSTDYDGQSSIGLPVSPTLGISSFTPTLPYSDSASATSNSPTTLADIAFHYWITDLRTDLGNNVPSYIADSSTDYDNNGTTNNADIFWNPLNDPATWQHMVTYTIGLGLNGNLTFSDANYNYPLKSNSVTSWPVPTSVGSSEPAKIDDLWHAAINARGHYFSAKDPNSLVSAFTGVLDNIAKRISSASAPAPSSPDYQTGTSLYQPVYDTTDWHGDLIDYDVTNLTTPIWNAKDKLNTQNNNGTGRTIITYDPVAKKGVPFTWATINANQQAALGSSDVLDYLRGDQSKEQSNGGTFRNRKYILGDIVDSAPVYVGPPDRLFPDNLESAKYSTFVANNAGRENMIWVGANDGMLHGFDANTGHEILSFVPSSVYQNLASLTSPTYSHKFFVDGSPTERDVFYNSAWHTVLVGGLNKGGQGIYALDITNPGTFSSETGAAPNVLWEFTDADDSDLGYTYSTPQVAKMNNGKWMAIFGNGYNNTEADAHTSTTGDAVLYLLDIQTGALVRKLDTGKGMSDDPSGNLRPNGLSPVAVVDADGNYTVDYIYAGDLFGNLWKFDVTSSDPTKWTVALDSSGNKAPLFIATDASGNRQPITTAPVVGIHTTQPGFIINFGTGKYLEKGDLSDTSVQSFYGIWDRNQSAITTIPRLDSSGTEMTMAQTILDTNTSQFGTYNARITSDNPITWYTGTNPLPTTPSTEGYLGWHMDLVDPSTGPVGERVTAEAQRIGDRIIFVTDTPSPDPCMAGGSSWIMELNAVTGQRLYSSPFDYTNNGVIDAADMVQANFDVNNDGVVDAKDLLAGSGIQEKNGGKLSRPTILRDKNGNEIKLSTTSTGKITKVLESGDQNNTGRRSWVILP